MFLAEVKSLSQDSVFRPALAGQGNCEALVGLQSE